MYTDACLNCTSFTKNCVMSSRVLRYSIVFILICHEILHDAIFSMLFGILLFSVVAN